MDFSRILFSNDYLNYTLQQLISCFDKLDPQMFERLSFLFSHIREYKLERHNVIVEHDGAEHIYYGFTLAEPESPKTINDQYARIAVTMTENTDRLEAEETELSEKETAFISCVKTLIKAFNYASPKELYILNELFDEVLLFNNKISSEMTDEDGTLFYYLYKLK